MLLLSMKTYLALLWGTSALFESTCAPVPETSMNSTAVPNETPEQQIGARTAHNETEKNTTHRPAEVSIAATAEPSVSPTTETTEAILTNRSGSTVGLVVMDAVAATTSSSGPWFLHTSAAATKTLGEAQPPHSRAVSETAKPTDNQLHHQSPMTSTDTTARAKPSAATSTATLATAAVSSPQPTSTTKPEVTSELSSTTSPAGSTQSLVFSSRSASTTTTMTVNHTSEAGTEITSTSQPVFVTAHITTSKLPEPAGMSSTTELPTTSINSAITTTSAATFSTSPAGTLIPRVPKRLHIPTTKSTPTTTEVSMTPASTEVPPCSNRGLVKHCLIAIASLAGLATIFMVSTVILCTKLSTRKYKIKKPQKATEMMCISALLPERNYNYTRQSNPVTNGVLVIHTGEDSYEDGGDNLTLSSFLPENDCLV